MSNLGASGDCFVWMITQIGYEKLKYFQMVYYFQHCNFFHCSGDYTDPSKPTENLYKLLLGWRRKEKNPKLRSIKKNPTVYNKVDFLWKNVIHEHLG